jgi:PRC-barrel domain
LKGYTIATADGNIGSVHTFYFDDVQWATRYLVVDTGGWLPRLVLTSPIAIGHADWLKRRLWVNLTKDQVEHSPNFDTDKPVSRQHELDYHNYYGWPAYWTGPYLWGGSMYPLALASAATRVPATVAEQEPADLHLRSVDEVIGYHIQAADDEIGHVEDFIVDDETWQLRYMVVDTSNWWFGKEVLVAPGWIDRVSWPDGKVYVNLAKETVKGSPQWDRSAPVDRAYEERLYDYYARPAYWQARQD